MGEVNVVSRPSWEDALTTMARRHTDVSYVEMSGLQFVDVAGVAALAVTAQNLPKGRIVLEDPPSELRRVLDMFWPDLSTIEVAQR
ncbi:STAS domain-containing protein [Streptomyces sp. NPDC016459]|uniref:STAS domain-containing protein n=1 Tax=Streptomyces sp. NPDC016459 TaxID=3157190 RepID=UPI0033EB4C8E